MGIWTVLLVGIGVSADAFAVSLARGLKIRQLHLSQAVLIGGTFGLFQAVMPILGWLLGTAFGGLIQAFDHWGRRPLSAPGRDHRRGDPASAS